MQLLRPQQGLLAYITSNSWLKAECGKSTRRWFAENHTPLYLLELGKDVFQAAIVDSCIHIARHGKSGERGRAADLDRLVDKSFPAAEHLWGELRCDGEKTWAALSAVERSVMDRMEAVGTPLKDWDVKIYRGVTTGLNAAFIIDTATKEALIAADPKSAEVIKPVLRGRDIQRYQAKWAGLWLIVAEFDSHRTIPEAYPEVYEWLAQFEEKLRARGQCRYSRSRKVNSNADYEGQHHWLELDNNPKDEYLSEFGKEKLFWMDMAGSGRFCYLTEEMYCNNKGYVLTGTSLKYLCAVLNSSIVTWLVKNTAPTTGMGLTEWIKVSVERIPIPQITAAKQRPFVWLVDGNDSPTIHATSGIPTLAQLLEGIDLDAKRLGLAERLYEHGLAQFNHYVNNRDGVIEESRRQMASLASSLGTSEISLAESVGLHWDENGDCEQEVELHQQYNQLSPQAQIDAQHKRKEADALRRIARDLETNTPRTDYTSVKERIASGNVSLDSLLSELPTFWQRIRNINERVERPRFKGRLPKREFLHVEFMTREWGLLVDKRAERDGDWIVSKKHNMLVPYQDPITRYVMLAEGMPLVPKDRLILVNQDPTSEWETEFWRKGGRIDQVYLLSRRGESPEQLRSAYRRRQINRLGWILGSLMLVADIIIVLVKYVWLTGSVEP